MSLLKDFIIPLTTFGVFALTVLSNYFLQKKILKQNNKSKAIDYLINLVNDIAEQKCNFLTENNKEINAKQHSINIFMEAFKKQYKIKNINVIDFFTICSGEPTLIELYKSKSLLIRELWINK